MSHEKNSRHFKKWKRKEKETKRINLKYWNKTYVDKKEYICREKEHIIMIQDNDHYEMKCFVDRWEK